MQPADINTETPQTTSPTASLHFEKVKRLLAEMGKVVVGQERMVSRLLMGLFTDGHILLEGVPGLAKTLTVNTLARVLDLPFKRIQFTPDLLPADLVGTMVYNQKKVEFEVKKGPIFANIVLADEINRSPAKVQSALLEAMQERQVTIGQTTYPMDIPFLVLATQNPLEQEGTYPLPEAQVDRFMMKVFVGYPSKQEELQIMKRMADLSSKTQVETILNKEDIFNIRNEVNKVSVSDSIAYYIVEVVSATRDPKAYGLEALAGYVDYGASPRGCIHMNLAAKAHAFFEERNYVLPEDVKATAVDVLNHRIILNYEAEAEGLTAQHILQQVLDKVPVNR